MDPTNLLSTFLIALLVFVPSAWIAQWCEYKKRPTNRACAATSGAVAFVALLAIIATALVGTWMFARTTFFAP